MVQSDNIKKFMDMQKKYLNRCNELDKRFSAISTFRIISFLAGIALVLIGITDNVLVAGIAGAVFLLIFIFLIRMHNKVVREKEVSKSRQQAVEQYIKRFGDDWREFAENGAMYVGQEDTVASDVDLLGPDSLYQLINVCHTERGKVGLADRMKLKAFNAEELPALNEAIGELVSKNEFAVRFEAAGIRMSSRKKKFEPSAFEAFCGEQDKGGLPVWAEVIRWIFPLIEIIFLVLWIVGATHYGLPLVGFLVLLAFTWVTKTVTDSVILPFYNVGNVIDDYLDMMKELEQEEFESVQLKAIQDSLCGEHGALTAFAKLRSISQAYNISFNPLIHQILSGIILWDYQLAHLMGKWKKKYGNSAADCFRRLAEMEELLSLSVVGVVRKTGWADIHTDDGCTLVAEDLYHPLIAPEHVKANSVSLDAGITIITGSNMSGKTTFLRTLAINLVLAYMGAPICGRRLSAGYMKIYTSMRITDDVAHGISTFYAEILRIKTMADYRKENVPMLCLIDEIFKGTNSADRIVGAREVITRLAGKRCMTVVSTHDFELCDITDAEGNAASNYHFEEFYENDELKFDYQIKNGRCTTTNARAILRMAGFEVADSL